ncbi:hypothetical protein BDN71DRAFT_1435017 [Pleurotus eryngii]|uniref:Uncharacterized protein n=1 Tax=Pleurotus eryngii TaxID=5323 RepID=A0A9P5ZPF1_PLEER|nr:hypothetical protein BDN71DRAFT_1435017 [Pleurotus eryngii]
MAMAVPLHPLLTPFMSSQSTADKESKKKRGKKGDFQGKVSSEGTAAVHKWFMAEFFPKYWNEFHLSLPLTEDKPQDASKLPLMKDKYLTAEQQLAKTNVMQAAVKKIKTWFNYWCTALSLNSNKDPWMPLLTKIHQVNDSPPCQPHECQFYMNMPEFKPKVDKEMDNTQPASGYVKDNYLCATKQQRGYWIMRNQMCKNESVTYWRSFTQRHLKSMTRAYGFQRYKPTSKQLDKKIKFIGYF